MLQGSAWVGPGAVSEDPRTAAALPVSPSKRKAFSLRINGRISSLKGAASKSANHRLGVIADQSELNSIFRFRIELVSRTKTSGKYFGD